LPSSPTDLVLIIAPSGRLDKSVLEQLGFDVERETISFEEILGTEFKLVGNNEFFQITDMGEGGVVVSPSEDFEGMWESPNSVTLRVSGVVRSNEDRAFGIMLNGIAYSNELVDMVIDMNLNSEVVQALSYEDGLTFADHRYMMMGFLTADEELEGEFKLMALGGSAVPFMITIYPRSFDQKDALLEYLDAWNEKQDNEHYHVVYTDLAGELLGFMSEITNAIAIVLIAFASISLVVSLIMIAIITYISVLERTKEIGILRALGARKKDITRVFNAETFIIGLFSGIIGVLIAWGLTFPANMIIEDMTNLPNVAQLSILHAAALLVLSTSLTVLGGHLPAVIASRRDAVEALRSD